MRCPLRSGPKPCSPTQLCRTAARPLKARTPSTARPCGGWAKRSQEQRDYISLKIDDPSLPAPLFANLCADEDGKTFQAIWSRSKARPMGRQQGRQPSRRD